MIKYYLFLSFSLVFSALHATNYYVDAVNGNNANLGTNPMLAFKTISTAASLTNAGDTVFIMAGDYSPFSITRPGNATAQIVYTNYPGIMPRIVATISTYNAVSVGVGANYITVNGLEVVGYGVNLSLANDTMPAQAAIVCPSGATSTTNVTFIGKYNGHGINVSGSSTVITHHVVISNCKVHDCGAGGIGMGYSDYITIDRNTVYNNCWYTPYGESGISFGATANYDNNTTTYRNIISNNVCYGNRLYVLWRGSCTISDGNGIILDIPVSGYTGKQLVVNNICFNNGGSGIHTISNNNVDFINNTAYMNSVTPTNGGGSIYAYSSNNPVFYNNIIVAGPGKSVNKCPNSTNVIYDYNVYFGGTTPNYVGTHSLIQDPKFVNPSADPAVADFHLQAGSFAINNGDNNNISTYTVFDKDGKTRPIGGTVDIGAYESNIAGKLNNYTIPPTTVQLAPGGGGGAGSGVFFGPYYSNTGTSFQQSRFAYVYPQALLANYGVPATPSLITSLQFNRVTATTQAAPPNSTVRVYLRNESSNNFGASNFDWTTILPGATNPAVLVYGGDATPLMGTASGWQTVNFQVPFTYTGSHLGVYIEYLQNGNIASGIAISWAYDNTSSNGSFYSDPIQANSVKYTLASGSATTISNTLDQSNPRHPTMKVGFTTGSVVPLPIALMQFNAVKNGTGVYLNWITGSESNNAGFNVQRSANGFNFTNIAFVTSKAPNGNSNTTEFYDFTDTRPLEDIIYYRLVQKDKDGNETVSRIVIVSSQTRALSLVTIYPNPVSTKLTALVTIASAGQTAVVSLQDLEGKILERFEKQLPSGYSNIELDVSKLSRSLYLLVIELPSGEKLVKKFMKE